MNAVSAYDLSQEVLGMEADIKRLVSSIRRAMFHMDSEPAKARQILADALVSVGAQPPQVSATRVR